MDPQRIRELREKMREHLEGAQACADELNDGVASYLVECALDDLRARQIDDLGSVVPFTPRAKP